MRSVCQTGHSERLLSPNFATSGEVTPRCPSVHESRASRCAQVSRPEGDELPAGLIATSSPLGPAA